MTELFKHQKEGIAFLKEKKKALLADEMGLGKTRQAIIAAGEDSQESILIVCPASLKKNWEREILAVFPEDHVFVGSGTIDPEGIGDAAWIIVNYDILDKNKDWIIEWRVFGKIDTLIADEIHYIKGKETLRAKALMEIAVGMNHVYGLTGTPLLNRPIELYNPLNVIGHPIAADGKRTAFAKKFCGAYLKTIFLRTGRTLRFMDESGATNLEELRRELKPYMLRRKKEDVLDLPAKIISTRDHELTKEERAEYATAWKAYLEWLNEHLEDMIPESGKTGIHCRSCGRELTEAEVGKGGTAAGNKRAVGKDYDDCFECGKRDNALMSQQLIELGKLKQICSRAKVARIVADAKNAIEQDQKVIIFSQYTETIKAIADGIRHKTRVGREELPAYMCVTLTGSDDLKERQEAVDRFQEDDKVKAFVANIKAAGVGLTLTKASLVYFADMEWSPEIHAQAEDRAHRIGQTGTVNVYYYVCSDTIEEDIMELLAEKKKVITAILDGKANRVKSAGMAEDLVKRIQGRSLSTGKKN